MNNNNEVDVLRVAVEKMMAAIAAKLLDEGNPERWNYRAIPSLPLDTRLPISDQRSVPRFLVRAGRLSLRNHAQDRVGRIFLHTLKAACATKAFPRTSIAILGAMKNFRRRRLFGCACWRSYHTGNILGFRLMCYRWISCSY